MNSTMEVFVDTAFNIIFSIGVNMWDTVLTMKQKIEKFQRIPVSKQTLYFDSKVLDDNLYIQQCKIFNNSRIFLVISPDYDPSQNNDQLPYQTEQSPRESSDRSNEFVNPQAWPVMVRGNNDQVLYQDWPVFVDTARAKPFSIQVSLWDTVLTLKQKIENSQRIPVSKQVLFFNSKVLDDNLDIMQCKIFNNSRLFLVISPDFNPSQNNDQLPYQTEQSLRDPSDQSNEFFYPQAWPVMVRSNNDHQVLPQTEPPLVTAESVEEFLMNNSPEMVEGKNNQLLHQNEQFSVLSNSNAETIYSQDQALSDISKIRTEENIQGQYSQVMMDGRNSQVPHQNELLSVPSNSIAETIFRQDQALSDISKIQRFGLGKGKEIIHGQYSPVMMQGRNNQVLHQNEQLSVPSFGEAIYSQDQALAIYSQNQALAIDDISKVQRFESMNTEEINHGQYFPLRNIANISLPPNYSEVLLGFKDQTSVPVGSSRSNKSESVPSNWSQELRGTQNLPPDPVGNSSRKKNKGIKTKQSPKPVSVKRFISTSDSPERKRRKRRKWVEFTVMVQPFQETRKIPVNVNAYEKVEKLKERLAKLKEMGELTLPEEGYFFIHKQDVLTDHHTFEENLVTPGDTIEIFRGSVTYDGSVPTRTRMSNLIKKLTF